MSMLQCRRRYPNETHKQPLARPVSAALSFDRYGAFCRLQKIISVPPAGTLAPPVADDAPATKTPSTTEAVTTEAATTEAATDEAATDEAAPEVRGTGAVSFCLTVTDLEKKTK